MPARPVAVDLTRLITRLRHASPTGIDRVDLAYARHMLGGAEGDGQRFGLVSTEIGPRILERAAALEVVEAVAAGWVEDVTAEDDPVYRALSGTFETGGPLGQGARSPTGHEGRAASWRRRRLQAETTLRAWRAAGLERLPEGAVYLHTSHLRLDRPGRFDWLYGRRDVRPVFFVHDLIPISHPEYGRPGEAERHEARMETVARHAAHVVVNSGDVGERFTRYTLDRGLGRKPLTVAPLGVEPVFTAAGEEAGEARRPTFVVIGTIEPRKNHLLLLNLWRDLAERLGEGTPRLVLVGRRGWEIENVADMLDRCPAVRAHVREVVGLTTHGLARLMRDATALLMPSFIEGYGLPVVEAAASGLPVIASDIPVHREIAGSFAHFLDPLDGPGWTQAVLALSEPGSRLRAELAGRLAGYAAPTWAAHFERVEAALAALPGA
ncbi:glycosyltransferase involved in cell wall biosynthesis [Methylorubrum rhodinum]|uniref:Glycosyltransferase involved in cell wall biosynthesis n=1 Tax=Methylorubrum rhodinum TaxID=29428 RepID=A0A840ZHA2_9HYPH|nr:glycosyltransferase family 1 protein [Methylorubrum rhodinum]MBB5756253.1 glycosyltransferase involved in cell wall biosynthesis [Methylorubrum rhodinum]